MPARLAHVVFVVLFICGCVTTRPVLVRPPHPTQAPRATLFRGVRVFDGLAAQLGEPTDVLVRGWRVVALAPAGTVTLPADAEEVDGKGRTLLPGLVDAHVHLGGPDGTAPWGPARLPNLEAQAAALLYSGVTTISSPAHNASADFLRDLATGRLAGPRVFQSSRIITAVEGHPVPLIKVLAPWPISTEMISQLRQVATAQDARKAVAAELAEVPAPAFIKLMYDDLPVGGPHLTREVLAAAIDEAHRRGAHASVHAASPQDAIEALEAGADCLVHTPWDGDLSDDQVKKLADSQVPIVTTRRLYRVMKEALEASLQFDALEERVMPREILEGWHHKPAGFVVVGFDAAYIASFRRYDDALGRNVKRLFDARANLIAGTDSGLPATFHGPALHRELQALVALGIPPAAVLRMATSAAAQALDPKADYGTIATGTRADLLLVEGDPTADISATERIVGVWQAGRRVNREAGR